MNCSSIQLKEYIDQVFGKKERSYLMGIAILSIFFLHFYCWYKGTRPWWIYFFSEGQIGVDIFIFLSTFGLEASIRKNGWIKFYINRARRILPVYFLFLLTLFAIFQNDISIYQMFIQSLGQLTGYSLFQNPDFFSTHFEFDWFTPALITIYLFYPFISKGLNVLAKTSIYIEIFFFFVIVIVSLLDLRFIHLPIKFLLYRLPIIMMGAITYIHIEKGEVNRLLILFFLLFLSGLYSNQHWFLSSSLVPIALTIYAMIKGRRPFYRFFSLLGRHSYEIYLAHIFPVTNFLMLKIFDNFYVYIAVTCIWTIIVTTIYSRFQYYFNKKIDIVLNKI